MNKSLKRIMAVLLLICMMGMNLSTIGIYGITYALSEDEISKQNAKTQDSNVEFNAYFEGGAHVKTEKMNSDVKLYLNIKLNGAGYLEKGVVSFQDTNFEIDKSISNDNIQSVDVKNNKILLNKINGGSNVVIEVPVNVLNADEVSIDNFSKETKTVFTATYINKDAKEKNVSKEIINKLSWDGTTGTTITPEIKTELTKYIPYTSDENSGVVLQVKVNSGIKDSILPIKATELNIQVPEINGIKPTSVNVIANQTKATNGMKDGLNFNADNYNYDAENSKLVISTQNLSNKISWLKNVSDEYFVTFVYDGKDICGDYAVQKPSGATFGAPASADLSYPANGCGSRAVRRSGRPSAPSGTRASARGTGRTPANPSGGMLHVGRAGTRAGLRRCAQAAFHVRDARAPPGAR